MTDSEPSGSGSSVPPATETWGDGADGAGGAVGVPGGTGYLEARLGELERRLAGLQEEIATRRLVIHDGDGRSRLVGELAGEVVELRLELPDREPGRRSAVVLFAGRDGDLAGGFGVQLWRNGDLVREFSSWDDEPA